MIMMFSPTCQLDQVLGDLFLEKPIAQIKYQLVLIEGLGHSFSM
jgi:hypothetical protein